MAKDAKADKAAKTDKAPKADAPEFKYGVADVAKALGVKEASARVQLRNHKVKKAGKSYGWNSREDLDAVVAKIKPKAAEKAADKAKGDKKKG